MEDCGEGVEEGFRERGYSEGDKDRRKKRTGLFKQLRGESESTMAIGNKRECYRKYTSFVNICHNRTVYSGMAAFL